MNSRCIKYLHIRTKTRLLEDNVCVNIHNFGLCNRLLVMTAKAQATKGEEHKLGFIKINYFCVSKDIIKTDK